MAHIVVVGPGALGSLFAARLVQAGHDISMACRTAKAAKAVQADGVCLVDDHGVHAVDVHAVRRPRQLTTPADMVILATKCADALDAAAMWRPERPGAPVVCLQNGILGDDLSRAAGPGYVPCTVGFPASWDGPGRSTETGTGALHVGTWPEGPMWAVHEQASDLLAAVAPVLVSTNMLGVAWTKLLINGAGMVGAMTGQSMGEMLRDASAKDAFLAVITEGYEAGVAAGVEFEKVAGFHPRLVRRAGVAGRWGKHALLGLIGRRYRRMRSSSQQSLGRGSQTEAVYLNGHIQATAREHGVATPVNDAVLATIQGIEVGDITAGPALLQRLPL